MEAFIFLLISIFIVCVYAIIYVSHRLLTLVKKTERKQFKKSFVVLLFVIVLSGSSAAMLVIP